MNDKIRKYVLPNLPYLFVLWFALKLGTAYRLAAGAGFGEKLIGMVKTTGPAFQTIAPGLVASDWLIGLAGAVIVRLVVWYKIKNAKKFRKDVEYGSARWGTPKDIKPFIDPVFQNNVILTGSEFLTMNPRPKNPANARNLNCCIIGSSGSGKTRFWLTPQLLQAHSSYVVVDPKGGVLGQVGSFLRRKGYKIKVFNSIDFSKSMHYNPLAYIKTESDILKFVNALISNTKGDGKEGDEFWTKAETLLYCALIAYIVFEGPEEERNMNTLVDMINEFFSRDTSKKVKAVKKACAENGKFMGTYPAYGYRRDPADKHHLVIDEETAPVVRRIFTMRCQGMGFRRIAVTLNEEGIQSPGVLYYQRKGMSDPRNVNHQWADATIKNILRNEVYIGNMVQGKCGTLSYKNRRLVAKPVDEWIRSESTHEPIISRDVWDTVVSIGQKKVRKSPAASGRSSIFTGLVCCADCGFKMCSHTEKRPYSDGHVQVFHSFICGNYAHSGKTACTIHSIDEDVLTRLVLDDIREKARYAAYDRDKLTAQIVRLKEKEIRSRLLSVEQELKAATARVGELEKLMQHLYEDKCSGTVPPTVFQTLMQKYEAEHAEKAAALPELEKKVREQRGNRQDADRWMGIIRRYTEITELDEAILFELVDRIEIGETQKRGKQRVCDIKVYYRYVGNVDDALAQETEGQYEKAV